MSLNLEMQHLYWAAGRPLVNEFANHVDAVPPAYAALYDLLAVHCWPWHSYTASPPRTKQLLASLWRKNNHDREPHTLPTIVDALAGACAGLEDLGHEKVKKLLTSRGHLTKRSLARSRSLSARDGIELAMPFALTESKDRPVCKAESADAFRAWRDAFMQKLERQHDIPAEVMLYFREEPKQDDVVQLARVCKSSPNAWLRAVFGLPDAAPQRLDDPVLFSNRPIQKFLAAGGFGEYINWREHALTSRNDLWIVSAVGFLNEAIDDDLSRLLKKNLTSTTSSPRYIFGIPEDSSGALLAHVETSARKVLRNITAMLEMPESLQQPAITTITNAEINKIGNTQQILFVRIPLAVWHQCINTYGTMIMFATFPDDWWYRRVFTAEVAVEAFTRSDPTLQRSTGRHMEWFQLEGAFPRARAQELYQLDRRLLSHASS